MATFLLRFLEALAPAFLLRFLEASVPAFLSVPGLLRMRPRGCGLSTPS